jgi:hypothetical protein
LGLRQLSLFPTIGFSAPFLNHTRRGTPKESVIAYSTSSHLLYLIMKAFLTSVIAGLLCLGSATGAQLPTVTEVEYQPFIAATERLLEALVFVGAPLTEADEKRVRSATRIDDQQEAIRLIQKVLDRYTVAGVNINPESRVKVAEGAAVKHLVQQGWRTFLVKVHNEAGINPELVAESPNARPQFKRSSGSPKRRGSAFSGYRNVQQPSVETQALRP